eukprot:g1910.t1
MPPSRGLVLLLAIIASSPGEAAPAASTCSSIKCESGCIVSSSGVPRCTCPAGFLLDSKDGRSCVDLGDPTVLDPEAADRIRIRRQAAKDRAFHRSRLKAELKSYEVEEGRDDTQEDRDDDSLVAAVRARQGRRGVRAAFRLKAPDGGHADGEPVREPFHSYRAEETKDDAAEEADDAVLSDAAAQRKTARQQRRVRRRQQRKREEKAKVHDVRAEALGVPSKPKPEDGVAVADISGDGSASASEEEDSPEDRDDRVAAEAADAAEDTTDQKEERIGKAAAQRTEERRRRCKDLTNDRMVRRGAAVPAAGGDDSPPELKACDEDVRESLRELQFAAAARDRRRAARQVRRAHREVVGTRREEIRSDRIQAAKDIEEARVDKAKKVRDAEELAGMKRKAMDAVEKDQAVRQDRLDRRRKDWLRRLEDEKGRRMRALERGEPLPPPLTAGTTAAAVTAAATGPGSSFQNVAAAAATAAVAAAAGRRPHSGFTKTEEEYIEAEAWKQADLPEPTVAGAEEDPLAVPPSVVRNLTNGTVQLPYGAPVPRSVKLAAAARLGREAKRALRKERREDRETAAEVQANEEHEKTMAGARELEARNQQEASAKAAQAKAAVALHGSSKSTSTLFAFNNR